MERKRSLLLRQNTRASIRFTDEEPTFTPQINGIDDFDFSDLIENWGSKDTNIYPSLSSAIALNGVHVR